MPDMYLRRENHWRKAQHRLPERRDPPPEPPRREGAGDFGLPFCWEAKEATLAVGVSVFVSLPDEERPTSRQRRSA
jgi:hypothetical protein